jgi:anti-anti-sigma factor
MMELQLIETSDSLTRVALVGMLDLVGVGQIETKFVAATVARGLPTIVDVSGMTFIASLGMGMLLSGLKGLQRKGAKLVLLKPQRDVANALTVARLTELLPIAENDEQAMQLLGAAV